MIKSNLFYFIISLIGIVLFICIMLFIDKRNQKKTLEQRQLPNMHLLCYAVTFAVFVIQVYLVYHMLVESCNAIARFRICPKTLRHDFRKTLAQNLLYIASSALTAFIIIDLMTTSMGYVVDKNMRYGMSHFIMMGLNENSDGVFNDDDYFLSANCKTREERTAVNNEEIKQRLEKYGFSGLLEHIRKKQLVNYGNGTFAWSQEGNFYRELLADKNTTSSVWLKSFYYMTGENYHYFAGFEQSIWLGILFCNLCAWACMIASRKENAETIHKKEISFEKHDIILVICLTLVGAMIFQQLFEARARYLFVNLPIFIIAAVWGIHSFVHVIEQKWFIRK